MNLRPFREYAKIRLLSTCKPFVKVVCIDISPNRCFISYLLSFHDIDSFWTVKFFFQKLPKLPVPFSIPDISPTTCSNEIFFTETSVSTMPSSIESKCIVCRLNCGCVTEVCGNPGRNFRVRIQKYQHFFFQLEKCEHVVEIESLLWWTHPIAEWQETI